MSDRTDTSATAPCTSLPLPESACPHRDDRRPDTTRPGHATCGAQVTPCSPPPQPDNSAVSDTHRHGRSGADTTVAAVQPVILVRYPAGVTGQTTSSVHLVPMLDGREAGTVTTLCGALLNLEAIETVNPGQGMPCTICILNQGIATAPAVEPPVGSPNSDGTGLISGVAYQAWGWPVTHAP
jgi:hypothetical protein